MDGHNSQHWMDEIDSSVLIPFIHSLGQEDSAIPGHHTVAVPGSIVGSKGCLRQAL